MALSSERLLELFEGMYADGETDVRCYSAKVVKTRTPHKCPGNFSEALHDVPAQTRMIVERALVNGKWGTSRTCEACVITWAKESGRLLLSY